VNALTFVMEMAVRSTRRPAGVVGTHAKSMRPRRRDIIDNRQELTRPERSGCFGVACLLEPMFSNASTRTAQRRASGQAIQLAFAQSDADARAINCKEGG
jgi:hypothetical protein